MPPLTVAVQSCDDPWFIVLLVGLIVTDNALFTTIGPELTEFPVFGTNALSVTSTFALSGELVVHKLFVCTLNVLPDPSWFAIIVFDIELKIMKLYVYGVVPPVSYDDSVVYCPESMIVLETAMLGVPSALSTTMLALLIEVTT